MSLANYYQPPHSPPPHKRRQIDVTPPPPKKNNPEGPCATWLTWAKVSKYYGLRSLKLRNTIQSYKCIQCFSKEFNFD